MSDVGVADRRLSSPIRCECACKWQNDTRTKKNEHQIIGWLDVSPMTYTQYFVLFCAIEVHVGAQCSIIAVAFTQMMMCE